MNASPTRQEAQEATFAALLVRHYRQAPPERSQALLDELARAVEEGGDRGELLRLVECAVAALAPVN